MEPDFPIGVERAVDLVSATLAVLETRAVTGLRCGGRADWKLVLAAGPQVLTVPVEPPGEGATALAQYIENGGWVAWSAVPTEGPIGARVGRLRRRLHEAWDDLVAVGADPAQVASRSLIIPTTGLGAHTVDQSDALLEMARELGEGIGELSGA